MLGHPFDVCFGRGGVILSYNAITAYSAAEANKENQDLRAGAPPFHTNKAVYGGTESDKQRILATDTSDRRNVRIVLL